MRSLRIRLVLISTLISGVAIIGMAVLSWTVMRKAVLESVELRLASISSRLITLMHPRVNWDSFSENISITYGDDFEDITLMLLVRDDVNENVIFSSIENFDSVRASFPEGFPSKAPAPQQRPEWHGGEGGLLGDFPRPRMVGGKEDGESGPLPPDRPKGPKGLPGQPGDGKAKEGHPNGPKSGGKGKEGRRGRMEYATAEFDGKTWRYVIARDRGYFVFAGIDLARSREELRQLEKGLFVGIPVALLLIAFGGWLVAERAMRPLRTISETANQITARELSARLPESKDSDPEISRLTGVLNRMMDRLESSFSHANRFSADVSHELKTPLAIIQGEIESALRECRPGTSEEKRLLVLREETNRLKSIIRSLMLLSQADVGELIRKSDRVNVSEELLSIVEDAEIMAESVGVRIESARIEDKTAIIGDAVLFRQALLNLVNNAIKYNEEGGYVRIDLQREEGKLRIEISNSGPGIGSEEKAKVFDRFFRADQARTRGVHGFGLGLSLAKAVIEGHGGRLVLEDSSGDETMFVAILPAFR